MLRSLNPLLTTELRLGVVSILMSVESADFNYLKEKTGATSGNLSVQLGKLTDAEYITVKKRFIGKKPNSLYKITERGKSAFIEYFEALQSYLPPPRG